MPNYQAQLSGIFSVTSMTRYEHIKTRFGTYKNMIVLYVVSDYSHISRLDNPVRLRLSVDFNMLNSKIKHLQSENDKIKPVDEIISLL